MPRGGRRPGAGRKPLYESGPAEQVNAQVPEAVKRWLERTAEREGLSLSEVAGRILVRSWKGTRKKRPG